MTRPPMRRRTVRDWTPEEGDGQEWLAQLAAEGWTPEYGVGVRVTINGQEVARYALIETATTGTRKRLTEGAAQQEDTPGPARS